MNLSFFLIDLYDLRRKKMKDRITHSCVLRVANRNVFNFDNVLTAFP